MKDLLRQIGRFMMVGGLAFGVDYGILWLLAGVFEVNYLVASSISFLISVVLNYWMTSAWVFTCGAETRKADNFFGFCFLSIIGLLLNTAIMWFGVDFFGGGYLLVKVFSTVVVGVYNFISRKLFLEKSASGSLDKALC